MAQPPPYDNQIPQPDDGIGTSQNPFLANFSQLFNAFNLDHVSLTAASNAGNHNIARMSPQAFPLTTNISEVSLYGKPRHLQTTELFFRQEGNQLEYQYSNYQIYRPPLVFSGGQLVQVPFFSFLPGNLIVYFGSLNPFGAEEFPIILNPVICNNILGVQTCNTSLDITKPPPPGVSPVVIEIPLSPEGLATEVILQAPPFSPFLANQYYLIFGNAVL